MRDDCFLAKNIHAFTKLKGRAARVVTLKLSLNQLRQEQRLAILLGVLEWAYGGDSADNILQAVTELLEFSVTYSHGSCALIILCTDLQILVSGLMRGPRAQ